MELLCEKLKFGLAGGSDIFLSVLCTVTATVLRLDEGGVLA